MKRFKACEKQTKTKAFSKEEREGPAWEAERAAGLVSEYCTFLVFPQERS